MKRYSILGLLALITLAFSMPAHSTDFFTVTQTAPIAPGFVDMGTTQTLTYTIANTATPPNSTTDGIYSVRFRLTGTCTGTGCTATQFTTASAPPAGWTRSSFSTTSITYTASTWSAAILGGQSLSFSVVVTAGKSSQDRAETLSSVRAGFTTATNFPNQSNRITNNTQGAWTLKSLQITSIQTTDTTGTPISAIGAGGSFRVVITLKNVSSGTLSGIVANPSPPTATKTGSWFAGSPNCTLTGTSPSPLNLATGASGTITYTCTTIATDSGTVFYSVTAVQNSTNVATSRTGTSNILSISALSVGIAITGPYAAPTCQFSGDTATFVMTVTNNTGVPLTTITPSSLTGVATSATIGAFSGPTTACSIAGVPSGALPLPIGGWCKYTWTAPVSVVGSYPVSGAQPNFYVTGSATANPGPITSPVATSNTQNVAGYVISATPAATNTSSTNVEFAFAVTNRGCANLNQTAIVVPAGFVFGSDAYSVVTDTTGTLNESWTLAGTTFTSPLNNAPAADPARMPVGNSGNYSLVFTSTPSTASTYAFTLTLTDQNGIAKPLTVNVPVATFGTGGINSVTPSIWREVVQ